MDSDFIIGGIGNDSLFGGGGNDIFCFGENFGNDIVEQVADGKVTLHFSSGSLSNWNESTLTYTIGENSVTVKGVTVDNITLLFGNNSNLPQGAFADAASEKIFEENNNLIA
jgi:Ca2+-binding RTX toxin-like protein